LLFYWLAALLACYSTSLLLYWLACCVVLDASCIVPVRAASASSQCSAQPSTSSAGGCLSRLQGSAVLPAPAMLPPPAP
jgi:hypothetical protein